MTRRMVFHHPLPLIPDAASASGIRPVQMKRAFEELGYEVWEVTGYTKERSRLAAEVRYAIRCGVRFDFCYSESSTMPMTMTNPNHLPTRPFLDVGFFRSLRRSGVPVGQFLRDIYWVFPNYRESLPFFKLRAALAAYEWDMRTLRHHVDRVFLPSLKVGEYINLGNVPISALEPGHGHAEPLPGPEEGASLFYVGGIGPGYKLHELFAAVKQAREEKNLDVHLTVCLRSEEWDAVKHEYEQWACPAIEVVHGHGNGLREYFERSNIAAIVVDLDEYWKLGVPVKLYEYIGAGKPVMVTKGSLAGDMVESMELGWTVDNSPDAVVELLERLANDPQEIQQVRARVLAQRDAHTWLERARQAVEELTGASVPEAVEERDPLTETKEVVVKNGL